MLSIEEQFAEVRRTFTKEDLIHCLALSFALKMNVTNPTREEAKNIWKTSTSI
jgi:hypothetical protein